MVWIYIITAFLFLGLNNIIWGAIGCLRYFTERIWKQDNALYPRKELTPITIKETAAIIAAHNEELTLEKSIKGLLAVLPKENIFVANDNSTDKTSDVAKSFGVQVYDINPNVGKAKAIVKICKKFNLLRRYKAILFNDADIVIDKRYLLYALPLLYHDEVACVAGHQEQRQRQNSFLESYFLLYRCRLWLLVQAFVRYGQTWKYTNVSYIVPGALSIYKTSVLRKIHIDAPHLIIEDFNMTFELQKKRLGKIAYAPYIKGYHQDPYTFGDYVKQMRRWYLGFWQTVYRNGIWPSFFWISTGEIIIQLLLYSLFIVSIPISIFALVAASYFTDPHVMSILISKVLFEIGLLLVIDYISTVITAIYLKKPALLIFGLGFFVLLFVDSLLYLATLPLTFASHTKVTGVWVSPKRKLAI